VTSNASDVERAGRTEWTPESVEEVADCLRSATRDRLPIDVAGAGTAHSWGGDTHARTTVRTHKLDSVLRYESPDMTIQVGAGMPVADLQSVVAEHGQRLALDAGRIPRGATVGGMLATADQGPSQLAYGGPRDLVIGAGLCFADGQIVRSGGNVIKNVAGYDLARLVSGSLGTLAVITDVSFRLHPLPAATGTLSLQAGIDEAVSRAELIAKAALEPVAAEWISGRLLIRFEGTHSGVQDRIDAAARIAGGESEILNPGDAAEAWAHLAEVSSPCVRSEGHTTIVRGLARPTDVSSLVQAATRIGLEQQTLPTVAAGVLTGRVDLRIDAVALSSHAATVARWRTVVEQFGGSTVLRERPRGLTELIEAWGSPPSAVAVLRAIKAAYDPDHLLGRGRFRPWF
jgi:glycolate oxidase FAD binding subunit